MLLFLIAGGVGAAWTIVPALLKARYELNEIITTLMMTFIGINLAGILIKGPFQDFSSNVPQTSVLDFAAMLPAIPGTRIHVGVLIAGAAAIVVWFLMSRTAFGLRLRVLGANARAARHMGLACRGSSSSRSSSPGSSSASRRRRRSSASGGTCAPTGIPRSACGSYPWSSSPACIRSP